MFSPPKNKPASGKILIVEDDVAISRGLCHNLKYDGYEVRDAVRGDAVAPIVADFAPDLIILDLMLPGIDGFTILENLRNAGNNVHVIVLSARAREDDKVRALELGADDYITKPFGLREFLARVNAAMRRVAERKSDDEKPICFADVVVFPGLKKITRAGQEIKLTPRAAQLLIFFAKNPNRVFSREELLSKAWPDDYEGTSRTVDNFVLQIRGQIEADPSHPALLVTVHGMGYKLITDA